MLACSSDNDALVPTVWHKTLVHGIWFRHVHECFDRQSLGSGDGAADLPVTLAEPLRSIERTLFAPRDVKNDAVHDSPNGRHDIALARAIAAPLAKSQFVIGKHRSADDGEIRDTSAKSR